MEPRRRALIISYYFAPQNTIGAVRPTKFAKYLTRMGFEVTVLCGAGMTQEKDPTLARDLKELREVRVVREWNPLRDYKARKARKAKAEGAEGGPAAARQDRPRPARKGDGLARRLADAAYLYLWMLSDRSFRRRAARELNKLDGVYDAVFSTYAPLSVHEVAREAKRRGLARRWIADFRDEVNMSFKWQKGWRDRYLRMVREHADIITAVSEGFLEMMDLSGLGYVLSNGFDREDLRGLGAVKPKENGRFQICYCGQLREGRKHVKNRDITPFFHALRGLIDEGCCREEELSLVYAGDEGGVFTAYAAEYGLDTRVEDHGRVTRERSLGLQQSADVLLMASWNMAGQTGILTGKLFEYMMMEKPIVCCMAGDLGGSELRRVLEETGMGFCHEEARAGEDTPALKAYLRTLISRWREDQPLLLSNRNAKETDYSYPGLTQRLARWIEEPIR